MRIRRLRRILCEGSQTNREEKPDGTRKSHGEQVSGGVTECCEGKSIAASLLRFLRWRRLFCRSSDMRLRHMFVPIDATVLHDEDHTADRGNVFAGIAIEGDDVRLHAG